MPTYFETGSISAFGNDRQPTKQVLVSAAQPMTSFIGVYNSNAAVTGLKASPGSMAFSTETGHGRIYIYNGSAWKFVNLDG